MRYLIAYDIANKARLQRIQRHTQQYCRMIQLSVYLFDGSEAVFNRYKEQLEKLICHAEDDIRFYGIASMNCMQLFGASPETEGFFLSTN